MNVIIGNNQIVLHNPHGSKSTKDLKLIVYDSVSLNDGQVKENSHFPPISLKADSQKLCSSTYDVLTDCGSLNQHSNTITPSNSCIYDVVLPIVLKTYPHRSLPHQLMKTLINIISCLYSLRKDRVMI